MRGSNEYHFGVGRGRVSKRLEKAIDKVVEKHGVTFVAVNIPGNGPSYWFAGPNRGEPFDSQLGKTVLSELESKGLWPINKDKTA